MHHILRIRRVVQQREAHIPDRRKVPPVKRLEFRSIPHPLTSFVYNTTVRGEMLHTVDKIFSSGYDKAKSDRSSEDEIQMPGS